MRNQLIKSEPIDQKLCKYYNAIPNDTPTGIVINDKDNSPTNNVKIMIYKSLLLAKELTLELMQYGKEIKVRFGKPKINEVDMSSQENQYMSDEEMIKGFREQFTKNLKRQHQ